jgi:hypothetical protein
MLTLNAKCGRTFKVVVMNICDGDCLLREYYLAHYLTALYVSNAIIKTEAIGIANVEYIKVP